MRTTVGGHRLRLFLMAAVALTCSVTALAGTSGPLAEKFNGADLKEARVAVECLTVTFKSMGHLGLKGISKDYFIRFMAKNESNRSCDFDPYLFRVVTPEGKQSDVKGVKITKVKRGAMETILPGGAKEYGIVMRDIKLSSTTPARLFYGDRFLGGFTK